MLSILEHDGERGEAVAAMARRGKHGGQTGLCRHCSRSGN